MSEGADERTARRLAEIRQVLSPAHRWVDTERNDVQWLIAEVERSWAEVGALRSALTALLEATDVAYMSGIGEMSDAEVEAWSDARSLAERAAAGSERNETTP